MLDIIRIVVAAFTMIDKANWVKFFEETFLVANISPEVVLGMLFLTLSNVDVDFSGWELRWKTYTTKKALPTTKRVKLVDKKEFVAAMLDPEHKTYIVHVGSVNSVTSSSSSPLKLNIYLSRRFQIFGLIAKETPTKVSAEYLDFPNVFSLDLISKLPEHTRIMDHAIKLVKV